MTKIQPVIKKILFIPDALLILTPERAKSKVNLPPFVPRPRTLIIQHCHLPLIETSRVIWFFLNRWRHSPSASLSAVGRWFTCVIGQVSLLQFRQKWREMSRFSCLRLYIAMNPCLAQRFFSHGIQRKVRLTRLRASCFTDILLCCKFIP